MGDKTLFLRKQNLLTVQAARYQHNVFRTPYLLSKAAQVCLTVLLESVSPAWLQNPLFNCAKLKRKTIYQLINGANQKSL